MVRPGFLCPAHILLRSPHPGCVWPRRPRAQCVRPKTLRPEREPSSHSAVCSSSAGPANVWLRTPRPGSVGPRPPGTASVQPRPQRPCSTVLPTWRTPRPTNVSTLGEKPQHRDKKITKPILFNISYPSQPMGLNYLWETVRTENNQPS